MAEILRSEGRGPGFDSWSGNLDPTLKLQLKILHAAMKTQHSRINKYILKKKSQVFISNLNLFSRFYSSASPILGGKFNLG